MKKLIILLVTLFAIPSFADIKIGYIDLQKAVQDTKAGQAARNSLEKEFRATERNLQKQEEALKKMGEELEKKAALLSPEARQKQEMDFQREMLKFRQTVAQSQQDISNKEREMTQPILDHMAKTIAEVAKKNSYTMVLEKREQNILWATDSVDLTAEVVKEFERTYRRR